MTGVQTCALPIYFIKFVRLYNESDARGKIDLGRRKAVVVRKRP